MNCPKCTTGKMEKVKDIMETDGISFEIFRCVACGEEIMDMKQLGALAKKYRKLRKAKEITFAKWGNSIAVRIPAEIVEEFSIKPGKHGLLTKEKEGIKIIPSN
ncbi:AbrB/MazE/SpoVT family DNA-binding domain-containing protein [Candidatus Woesearchaeota archaeon]|nr:AbrB/MazE/SpoVT family DNA-binding domain-containing protein [Candidatus Woesearchaeota archaeon]